MLPPRHGRDAGSPRLTLSQILRHNKGPDSRLFQDGYRVFVFTLQNHRTSRQLLLA